MTDSERVDAVAKIAVNALQEKAKLVKRVFVLEVLLGAAGIEDIDEAVLRGSADPRVAEKLESLDQATAAGLDRLQQFVTARLVFAQYRPTGQAN